MPDILSERMALFVMPNERTAGIGSDLQPLSLRRHSMTGRTKNNIPGVSQEYATNQFGRIEIVRTFKDTPGGLNQFNIVVKRATGDSFLQRMEQEQKVFPVWRMFSPCTSLDNPQGWLSGGQLEFFGATRIISGGSETDGPVSNGTSTWVTETKPVANEYDILFLPLTISSLTFDDALNITDLRGILVIQDPIPENCISAYRGPGKHIMVVQNADTGVAAEVFYSVSGGGAFATMSSNPFGADEDISHIVGGITTGNRMRIAVGRGTTDAGAPAEIAYGDITFGAEATITFTSVAVGVNNGDIITMMAQLFPLRAYYGTDNGDLYVSTDQHESNTLIASPGVQINVAIKGYGECDDVWFGGASNALLVERGRTGNVSTRVGPSGGGAFSALALSNDGLLFAGNATSLYVSSNEGENAGGWALVKNFGANHTIRNIHLPKGDPYNIYCSVDDSGGAGEFWHSNDGGNSWNQLPETTNLGYFQSVANIDNPNEFWIAGAANATPLGVVEKITASNSGC